MSDVIISGNNGGQITAQVTEVTITAHAVSNAILATVNEAGVEVTCQSAGSVSITASLGALVTVTVQPQSEISVTVGDVETDPIFTAWDKSYNDLTNKPFIPTALADLSDDATHRLVTDTEKSTWNAKQPAGSYLTSETDPVYLASEAAKFAVGDALKLSGIEAGAQKNVAETDPIFTAWNKSYNDLIDKPTIPAAQIQSDWNQANNLSLDYIKNKPTIPAAGITALTGDVTAIGPGSVPAAIAAGAVSLAKMANLAAYSIIGNNTASPLVPQALTIAQVLAMGGLATSITGGPLTLAASGAYTLTIPATGTAALLGTSNVFTASQSITGGDLTLDNNRNINAKDTGGTARGVLNLFTNNYLYVGAGAGLSGLVLRASNNNQIQILPAGNLDLLTNGIQRLRASNAGQVTIGLGSITDSAILGVGGTLASITTSAQYVLQAQPTIIPAGASLSALYGLLFLPTVSGSAPITELDSIYARADLSATRSGAITTLINFKSANPFYYTGNTGTIGTLYGHYIEPMTRGTVANWGIYSDSNAHFFSGPASGITAIFQVHATTPGDAIRVQASNGTTVLAGISALGLGYFTSAQVGAADYYYLGVSTTNGTWRVARSGNNLEFQRRENGSYVTKQVVSA